MPPALLLLAAMPLVEPNSFCHLDDAKVFVHVAITSRWQTKTTEQKSSSAIWQLNCDRKTKQRTGAKLGTDLKKGRSGALLVDMMDLSALVGATLRSIVGNVAVISWGVYLFVLDAEAGTVTMSAESSISGIPERGVGSCTGL